MKTDSPVITRLVDYSPPVFQIKTVDLFFDLQPENTTVKARYEMSRNGDTAADLLLDGEDIKLVDIKLDGEKLAGTKFRLTKSGMTVFDAPAQFELEITTTCNPSTNSTLMGLYISGGRFCTQCEAQGFRRITYFPDRPDVLATYKVRIEADKKKYPTLLANGNCTDEGSLAKGRHFAVWEDPFPKPCYLFALVAGEFDIVSDSFDTMSGRTIPLDIYVDPGDASRADYAMDSLKRAMKWDEEAFGREYDLDRFMVVAVRDFNFGAMENKGLNIFNSSLLLADEASATDLNFEHIESVIAHEYFHNWTGNRITCRDWFQLCLKEGFTVFRDQEFSADQRGPGLQRIKDVSALRARQFPEDAGPLAHPVRPASYMKIDNFYTATIYEKGAELIRMLKTILGEKVFREGCDTYFNTLDGTAATIEQFIDCFEKASGKNLTQFMRWYEQAGTPHVNISSTYDDQANSCTLVLKQKTNATPGQSFKQTLMMPVDIALLDKSGNVIAERLVIFVDKKAEVKFENIAEKPIISAFRKFSAPVILENGNSPKDSLVQIKHDTDLFNRWEAGQALARNLLTDLTRSIETGKSVHDATTLKLYVDCLGETIADKGIENGFKAAALTPPSDSAILQAMNGQPTDPLAIRHSIKMLRRAISERHEGALTNLYNELSAPTEFKPDAEGAGRRALRNTCLHLLAANAGLGSIRLAQRQFETATNMTEELSALLALVRIGGANADESLQLFFEKWENNPLVVDKWFAANAQYGGANALKKIKELTKHQAYQGGNPNRVRALIGGLAVGNPETFHKLDGSGYQFYADNVISIDKANPQIAARLLGSFGIWNKLDASRAAMIRAQLSRIINSKPSANVVEIATKSLGD
jgi:aminopeptidase N